MDRDAADDTSHTHQDAPTAVWTTTPPKNAERHPNRPRPVNLLPLAPTKLFLLQRKWTLPYKLSYKDLSKEARAKEATTDKDNAHASIAVVSSNGKPYAFEQLADRRWQGRATAAAGSTSGSSWIIDSGASHMCKNRNDYAAFRKLPHTIAVRLGNDSAVMATTMDWLIYTLVAKQEHCTHRHSMAPCSPSACST